MVMLCVTTWVFVWLMWTGYRRSRGEYTPREKRMIAWLHHQLVTAPQHGHGLEAREITLTMLIEAGRDPDQVEEERRAKFAADAAASTGTVLEQQ